MTQAPPDARPMLEYDGRLSELFGIFLLNLLLTIITLGIFRFWAITRLRRYLSSHMRFEDTRFTYTGKGKELFLGFFLAMTILGLIFAGAGMVAAALARTHPGLAAVPIGIAYFGLFILFGGAQFSAQRYRLSRTEWRGIRGGMEGSALRYGVTWVLFLLLTVTTLYQAVPWMQVGLARRRINATRFGSGVFRFDGRAGRLYLTWLGTLIGVAVLMVALAGAGYVLLAPTLGPVFSGSVSGRRADTLILEAVPIFVILFLMFSILSGVLATWYYAALVRLMVGQTSMTVDAPPGASVLRFHSTVTAGKLLWLFVSNAVIALITLGFGLPIVLHRSARFIARTTLVSGALDATTLVQSSLARPRMGEGFLQALDPGVV